MKRSQEEISQTTEPNKNEELERKNKIQKGEINNANIHECYAKLFGSLLRESGGKNVVCSPVSIFVTLSMVLMGASGRTFTELVNGLFGRELEEKGIDYFRIIENELKPLLENLMKSFNVSDECGTKLDMVNRIYLSSQYSLLESYQALVNQTLDAQVDLCDFQKNQKEEIEKINKFVSDFTKGMINNIVDEYFILPTTRIVSVNAIFFSAQWKDQFDPNETKLKPFHNLDKSETQVEMMRKIDTRVLYGNDDPEGENPQFHWIKLPYRNDKHSMVILMPLNETMENSKFDEWIVDKLESMYYFSTEIFTLDSLSLPKMKIAEKVNLKNILQTKPFHMKSMFSENANFSRMIQDDHFPISDILHECTIEINEEGTRASAVTVKGRGKSANRQFYNFDVNRPFALLIIENETHQVLFMSKVNQL